MKTAHFDLGRVIGMQEIQDRDGLSFTAAFSERLVGDNLTNHPAACNYTDPARTAAGGRVPAVARPFRLARRRWLVVDAAGLSLDSVQPRPPSRQPVFLHRRATGEHVRSWALRAGTSRASTCLYLDGRVSVVRPSIDLKIWKEFARIGTLEADSSGQ